MANINVNIAISNNDIRNWVYKDINENFSRDNVKRDISSYTNINAVNNSLLNLFRFKKGQRPLYMDYGIDLDEFIYQPMNNAVMQAMGNKIMESIKKWEPRIALGNIDITPNYNLNHYLILITYSVPLLGEDIYTLEYNLERG